MKKILVLTDFYYPFKSGRSEKMVSRVRSLLNNGYAPIVYASSQNKTKPISSELTVKPFFRLKHTDSNKDKKIKVALLQIHNMIAVLFNTLHIMALIKRYDIGYVYTVNNPALFHLSGFLLKRFSKIKWLAELRDSWCEFSKRRNGFVSIHQKIESFVSSTADIIFWHEGMRHSKTYWESKYGLSVLPKLHVLEPLGSAMLPLLDRPGKIIKPSDKLTIGYFGGFYGEEVSPKSIIDSFIQLNIKTKTHHEMVFFGQDLAEVLSYPESYLQQNSVFYKGKKSGNELLLEMEKVDIFLLLMGESDGVELAIPTKLWDYLVFKKPILAVVPERAKAAIKFLRQTNSAVINRPEDLDIGLKNLIVNEFHNTSLIYTRESSDASFVKLIGSV